MGYLNNDGLLYLWGKIKAKFATKTEVQTLQESLSDLGYGNMMKETYDTNNNGIVDNAQKVNDHTVESDVPAGAVFTDTTYTSGDTVIKVASGKISHNTSGVDVDECGADAATGVFGAAFKVPYLLLDACGHITFAEDKVITIPSTAATTSTAGLQSAADKTKLDALPTAATLESTYAKKTDVTGVYRYKGSVASASALPTSGREAGDVYDIQSVSTYGGAGMNVAWTGTAWDALGEVFSITSITNTEIDTICV